MLTCHILVLVRDLSRLTDYRNCDKGSALTSWLQLHVTAEALNIMLINDENAVVDILCGEHYIGVTQQEWVGV